MSTVMTAIPLHEDDFALYGQVIEAKVGSGTEANQGTAARFNHVAKVDNLRPTATPNMCVFRSIPAEVPFSCRLLERHLYSTQAFIPMGETPTRYLVIVCLNGSDNRPDITTLKAFVARGTQGISYNAGCWHHPMIALDHSIDFACLVHEDGSAEDCHVLQLAQVLTIIVPC